MISKAHSPTRTHIVEKKDVFIILNAMPLLFVKAPPVFVRVEVVQEESTSIFVKSFDEHDETPAAPVINEAIRTKLKKLCEPFYRQVYTPLQFRINNELVKGTIDRCDGDTIFIRTQDTPGEVTAYIIEEIEEILWRGAVFSL